MSVVEGMDCIIFFVIGAALIVAVLALINSYKPLDY